MTIVAYKNAGNMIAVMQTVYLKHHTDTNDSVLLVWETIDGCIRQFYNLHSEEPNGASKNEIPKRRIAWFIYAKLVVKVCQIAEADQRYADDVAVLWIHLIKCSRVFKAAISSNIIWEPDEKVWFGKESSPFWYIEDEREAMIFSANRIMPKWLHNNDKITQFLSSINIKRYGSSGFLDIS